MSENSKIEWCNHTFNAWIGCAKVSPGCANCYAAAQDNFRKWTPDGWGKGKPRKRTSESNWKQPIKWNRDSERARVAALHSWPAGKPMPWNRPRVFCASLADWLDDEVPIEWLADLLKLIRDTPNLDWQMLTKRPENWRQRIEAAQDWHFDYGDRNVTGWLQNWWKHGIAPDNIWVGTSTENQEMADKRIPILLSIPAKVRFLSCEPLLGSLEIKGALSRGGPANTITDSQGIDWVICGGESGSGARPMKVGWARSLRMQCKAAQVPFFMKQMGGTRKPFAPIPDALTIRQFPTGKVGA